MERLFEGALSSGHSQRAAWLVVANTITDAQTEAPHTWRVTTRVTTLGLRTLSQVRLPAGATKPFSLDQFNNSYHARRKKKLRVVWIAKLIWSGSAAGTWRCVAFNPDLQCCDEERALFTFEGATYRIQPGYLARR